MLPVSSNVSELILSTKEFIKQAWLRFKMFWKHITGVCGDGSLLRVIRRPAIPKMTLPALPTLQSPAMPIIPLPVMSPIRLPEMSKCLPAIPMIDVPEMPLPRPSPMVEFIFNGLMWVCGSMGLLLSIDIKKEELITGMVLKLPVFPALMMIFATFMLIRSLQTPNYWQYCIPWVILAFTQGFTTQMDDAIQICTLLIRFDIGYVPWIVLFFYTVTILVRCVLIFVVIIIGLQQWNCNQAMKRLQKQ